MLLRKYGVSSDIYFPLIKAGANDFATSSDYTHASGDIKISKDGGTAATATNTPSAITMGNGAMWKLTLTATELTAALVKVTVIDAATKAIEDQMILIETYGHANAQHAFDLDTSIADLYHADIQFTRDQANTQDEWSVTWFKNGVRQTSGITSPTIQLVKRVDGTDLLASTAMTQIGSTASYKYDATGASRITVGEAVIAIVTATIDSSSRTFSRLVGRDFPHKLEWINMRMIDLVRETTATTGTGNITLAGAVTGYQTFNTAFSTNKWFWYGIRLGTEWEVGLGYLSASTTLVRYKVLGSSNSNALVNFSAGIKELMLPYQLLWWTITDSGKVLAQSGAGCTVTMT